MNKDKEDICPVCKKEGVVLVNDYPFAKKCAPCKKAREEAYDRYVDPLGVYR